MRFLRLISPALMSRADGRTSPILGTTEVNLCIDGFHSRVTCFVTTLATEFDKIIRACNSSEI